jgi:recombination protein RecT
MSEQSLVLSTPKQLLDYLQKSKSAIGMALPGHLNADRMCRLALTCFSTTPKLRECTAQSILSSVVVAAQLGLEPGIAGQGYLIPYGKTCTFIPGWQGLVGLLNNTGRATAWTGCVFEGDEWDFELGSAPHCHHKPGKNFGDPDKLTWVYACGKVNGSEQPVVEAYPIERIKRHRDRYNKMGLKHYSYGNMEMYARKVVLLQVLKYMPRSVSLNDAIQASDAAEMGRATRIEEGVIVEVEAETDEKFETRKAPVQGAAGTGDDHPAGLEPKKEPGNVVPMTSHPSDASNATDPEDAELERAAQEEQKRLLAEAEKKKAAEKAPVAEIKSAPKVKSEGWHEGPGKPEENATRHREELRTKLKSANVTEAQMCQYLKPRLGGITYLTIEDVEAMAPTLLALTLAKFDQHAHKIAEQPGKSAQ